jgi:hypothetical protein
MTFGQNDIAQAYHTQISQKLQYVRDLHESHISLEMII